MKVFTTGQVARVCGVSSPTVCQWFDNGLLKGYREVGKERKIPQECLIEFLELNDMPLNDVEDFYTGKILIVTKNDIMQQRLSESIKAVGGYYKISSASIVDTAIEMMRKSNPDLIIIDFSYGEAESQQMCSELRAAALQFSATTMFMGLVPKFNDYNVLDELVAKPFNTEAVARKATTSLAARKKHFATAI